MNYMFIICYRRGGVGVTPYSTGGAGTLYFKGENESLLVTSNNKYQTYSITPINLIHNTTSNFTIKDSASIYYIIIIIIIFE